MLFQLVHSIPADSLGLFKKFKTPEETLAPPIDTFLSNIIFELLHTLLIEDLPPETFQ